MTCLGPDNDVQQSAEHIKQLFLSKNKLESRKVLVEFTCATDSSTIGQHIVNALEFIEEEKRRVDLHAASQSRLQSSSPSQLQPQSQTLNRSASSTSIPPASSSKPPGLTRNYSDLSDKSISFLINEFDAKTLSNTPVETVAEENSWAREGL